MSEGIPDRLAGEVSVLASMPVKRLERMCDGAGITRDGEDRQGLAELIVMDCVRKAER